MLIPLLALLQVQAPLAARPDADSLRPLHNATHYDVMLVVGDTGSHVVGQVQTSWRLRSSDPVRMDLDTAMRVVRVLIDGKENTRLFRTIYGRDGQWVVVPHEKQAGDSLHTLVRYHGSPHDGLIIRNNLHGARTVFADNWPDRVHDWIPTEDHPSDKATVAFQIEVPAGDMAIANGVFTQVDTLPRGRTVWHYSMNQPIPPYGMVVGVGRFALTPLEPAACSVRCVPLTIVTYPEDSAWAVGGPFRRAGEIVDFMSGVVGPFPYDRLSHVQSTTIFGGSENPTAIFYDEKAYVDHTLSEKVVAHETAHQWFGDAVTEDDWHHLWLSEGFATYLAALWAEHLGGADSLRAEMGRAAESVFRSSDTERPILDPAATDLMGLLNSNNYPKGAWVLHSLRGLVGDSAFFHGIREYYRQYRDSTALSADFAHVMSAAAGQDLDWYFLQALTQPGYPTLDVTWRHQKHRLTLEISETQKEAWGSYRLPGLVVLVDGTPHRVNVTGRSTRVVLEGIKNAPTSVVVDPWGWWLVRTAVRSKE